jgi:hypothetical protein
MVACNYDVGEFTLWKRIHDADFEFEDKSTVEDQDQGQFAAIDLYQSLNSLGPLESSVKIPFRYFIMAANHPDHRVYVPVSDFLKHIGCQNVFTWRFPDAVVAKPIANQLIPNLEELVFAVAEQDFSSVTPKGANGSVMVLIDTGSYPYAGALLYKALILHSPM